VSPALNAFLYLGDIGDSLREAFFMFASTNLVVELGVVLLALMGWQFALAEFIGGPIMIAGLALVGGFVFSPGASSSSAT